jgi:hypothetical protein
MRDFLNTEQRRLHRIEEQIKADIKNNPLHQRPEILKRGHLMPHETGHQFDERNQPVGISGHTNAIVKRKPKDS